MFPKDELRRGLKKFTCPEDNQFNQMVAEDTMHMVIPELTLDIVDNGVQAIEKLKSGNYDLVILIYTCLKWMVMKLQNIFVLQCRHR